MSKNPLFNASAAFAYIVAVVCFIMYGFPPGPDTMVTPVIVLSLLVLSVLVMGYTLLLAPLALCFEKQVREGVKLFVQTLGFFAGIVIALIVVAVVVF